MNNEEILLHWLEESSQATATFPQPDPLDNTHAQDILLQLETILLITSCQLWDMTLDQGD
jgi:hypothetical protein